MRRLDTCPSYIYPPLLQLEKVENCKHACLKIGVKYPPPVTSGPLLLCHVEKCCFAVSKAKGVSPSSYIKERRFLVSHSLSLLFSGHGCFLSVLLLLNFCTAQSNRLLSLLSNLPDADQPNVPSVILLL